MVITIIKLLNNIHTVNVKCHPHYIEVNVMDIYYSDHLYFIVKNSKNREENSNKWNNIFMVILHTVCVENENVRGQKQQ